MLCFCLFDYKYSPNHVLIKGPCGHFFHELCLRDLNVCPKCLRNEKIQFWKLFRDMSETKFIVTKETPNEYIKNFMEIGISGFLLMEISEKEEKYSQKSKVVLFEHPHPILQEKCKSKIDRFMDWKDLIRESMVEQIVTGTLTERLWVVQD